MRRSDDRSNNRMFSRDVSAVEKVAPARCCSIRTLREYLIKGKPRHIDQPRRRAVHAVAIVGATGALLKYLTKPKHPSSRHPVWREDR